MVQCSWEKISQQARGYSTEVFESFFTSRGATASLAPTLYEGDASLGFAAGFVRPVEYHEPEEHLSLLKQFLSKAVAQGARMVTVPVSGYTDPSPFKKFRFSPTGRVLHCYLTLFSRNLLFETLLSMYLL